MPAKVPAIYEPLTPLSMSPHRASPIEVVVRAAGCDPQQSEAFGGGLAGGNLREACTFAVRARDKWGHPCDPMSKPVPRWRASTAHEAAWPGVAAPECR